MIIEALLNAVGLSENERALMMLTDLPVSLQCRDFLGDLSQLLKSTSQTFVFFFSFLFAASTKKKTTW